jgi:hypothetical protein
MFRKLFSIGLIAAACVAGFCDTSEAGHRHRRARNVGARNHCEPVQQSACNNIKSGCSTYSDSCCGNPSSQQYGSSSYGSSSYGASNYGYNGVLTQSYGSSPYQGGQVDVNGRVGGNMTGNTTILSR